MSTCISQHGEYSEHEPGDYCPLCGVFNEAAILAERDQLRAEVDRLHTWQGLLSLLDEHWPEDVFPTLTDDPARDTGPRLVSALRRLGDRP